MADLPVHGYAAAALHLYKDKEVDINTGETQTTLIFNDWQSELKHVINGIIRDAVGDALIVECKTRLGTKMVLLNAWSIIAITEVSSKASLKDLYKDEHLR